MNIENTQSQMRKGVLEYCVLSIIKRGEAYPGDIIDEMKSAGLQLLEGTLYPLLNRLKNADILSYRWVESTSGPPRKYFRLTEKGNQFYIQLEATWQELASGVAMVTRQDPQSKSGSGTASASGSGSGTSSGSDSSSVGITSKHYPNKTDQSHEESNQH
jgi:PadR family transcriptional regulator PadR